MKTARCFQTCIYMSLSPLYLGIHSYRETFTPSQYILWNSSLQLSVIDQYRSARIFLWWLQVQLVKLEISVPHVAEEINTFQVWDQYKARRTVMDCITPFFLSRDSDLTCQSEPVTVLFSFPTHLEWKKNPLKERCCHKLEEWLRWLRHAWTYFSSEV